MTIDAAISRRLRIIALETELQYLRSKETDAQRDAVHEATLTECRALVRGNQRVAAMKLFRSRTGCDLREARQAIERLEKS